MAYLAIIFGAAVCAYILTRIMCRIAHALDITDKPTLERKKHARPIPLLGGVAIILSFLAALWLYFLTAPSNWPSLIDSHVTLKFLVGITCGALFLMIGGILDDRYSLTPRAQIIWPFAAIASVILSGIGIEILSNPFGGVLTLNTWNIQLFEFNGVPRFFTVGADLLTIGWLLTCIYTTKFLDGLDGLVAGMTVIGASIIGIFSLWFFVNIPTALIAFLTAGVFAGFLILNSHPAKIFLGEAGSTFAGFILGVLAIISGAKFAIALLILGIPILDVGWVIIRRVFIEKKSPFVGDRKHLHFRLIDAGLTQRQAVGLLYFFAICFGSIALFLQSTQKIYALAFLVFLMLSIGGLLFWWHKRLIHT